ncbi:T9SS type A sorting domain-containing protein [bacterium]|nr:T9SS type A sorting domain-containing protein [bacterium]
MMQTINNDGVTMRLKNWFNVIGVALLLPLMSYAQNWPEQVVATEFAEARSVQAADIDGDGDTDLAGVARDDGTVAWWSNDDGNGTSWTEHMLSGDLDGVSSVFIADIENDGDMDILAAAREAGDVVLWENADGSGMDWTEHIVENTFPAALAVHAADMDGDQDMDVFVAAADPNNEIAWWENDNGSFGDREIIDVNFQDGHSITTADVDDDGDLDVLVAGRDANTIAWWENTDGTGMDWTEHTIDDGVPGATAVRTMDMDMDGDLDVVGAGREMNTISWWENTDGTGMNWSEHVVDGFADWAISVDVKDMDGDSDPDIVAAAYSDEEIAWWENNDGIARNWTQHSIGTELNGPISVFAADIDGDGQMDVASAILWENTISWWQNPGTTDIEEADNGSQPAVFALSNAYPNPFNPTTSLTVNLPESAELQVSVYNALGREVVELANDRFEAGEYTLTFNANGLPSGVYLVRAVVPGQLNAVRKIMLLR